jgi:Uma2 family endonuclease
LAVIRGSEDDFWQAHPATAELVIEICVTSHDYDRSKLRAYATAGVRECWLVLAPEKQVEVYRRPLNGEYAERLVLAGDQALASAAVPGVEITLSSLWEITAK